MNRSRTLLTKAAARGAVLLLLVCTPSALGAQESFDVLLRNARVMDGTGNPWFRADVALRGDRIAAIGELSDVRAAVELDLTGLYLAPGFIDSHSHAGGGLGSVELSQARPLLAQGITTVLVNPDGGGPVDLAAQRSDLLDHGLGVNAGQMVPHGSVRREVLGTEARAPDPEELDRMRALVREGMEEGAFGLSSGTFYSPGSFAENSELVELGRVVAEYGGAYQSHIRDESDYTVGVLAAVEEVIEVAREAQIPGVVTHVKALGPPVWGFSLAIANRVERAREVGIEVYADQYPYIASATGLSSALVPRWAEEGGRASLMVRLDRTDTAERIREEMAENLARRGGADRIQFRRFPEDPGIEGRTLADVALDGELDPISATIELLRQGSPSIVSFNMDEDDVRLLMAKPWTMTASDGGLVPMGEGVPHPRNYGTFPRKIRQYVLEEGTIDLSFAIRSMTSLPASVYRIRERGLVREGMIADIVVFDLERLQDPASFTDPHRLAEGVVHLFVNGEAAVLDGQFTGALAGEVLRR